jgi:hypothetical protein
MSTFARTYQRRLDLLDGRLTILFLNGLLPNAVPLLFGELFTAVLYDGLAVDPGAQDAEVARSAPSPSETEDHEDYRYPRS